MSIACVLWHPNNDKIYMVADSCVLMDNKPYKYGGSKLYEFKEGIWIAITGKPLSADGFAVDNVYSPESITREPLEYLTEGIYDIEELAKIIFEKYVCLHANLNMIICAFMNEQHCIIKMVSNEKGHKFENSNDKIEIIGTDECEEAVNELKQENKIDLLAKILEDPVKIFQCIINKVIRIREEKGLVQNVMYPIKVVELSRNSSNQYLIEE